MLLAGVGAGVYGDGSGAAVGNSAVDGKPERDTRKEGGGGRGHPVSVGNEE